MFDRIFCLQYRGCASAPKVRNFAREGGPKDESIFVHYITPAHK